MATVDQVLRYSAFTSDPAGGNPAGVWIGNELPGTELMQAIAAEIGYSETVFISPSDGMTRTVRYFTPETEVPFCGHATIALGVVLGDTRGAGRYTFNTPAGAVTVDVSESDGGWRAALTSVQPSQEPITEALLEEVLDTLGWSADEIDLAVMPMRIYAGLNHLVLAAATSERLADLSFDFERLREIMVRNKLDTLQLIWRESTTLIHSRNPCPGVGIVEDPATGSAAAALGGYLRDQGLVTAPTTITVQQGFAMGRPSTITVQIPEDGGIVVSGTAVVIPE
jgi:PhzF family phenazine biosynthesis protein